MGKYIDITGQKFGLLTALNVDHKTKWDEHWLCQCDCGNKVTRSKSGLRKGLSTSCGCEKYRKVSESLKVKNRYDIKGNVVFGCTSNGEEFIFDTEDYEKVSQFSWYKMKNGYICHKDKNEFILLHRLIMNPPDNMDVDHKNNIKIDNRKENLRICNRGQNLAHKSYENKTSYRGVVELPSGNFMAQIRNKYLGVYKNPQEAHDAYAKEAIKEYGEFICEEQINISENQYAEKIS